MITAALCHRRLVMFSSFLDSFHKPWERFCRKTNEQSIRLAAGVCWAYESQTKFFWIRTLNCSPRSGWGWTFFFLFFFFFMCEAEMEHLLSLLIMWLKDSFHFSTSVAVGTLKHTCRQGFQWGCSGSPSCNQSLRLRTFINIYQQGLLSSLLERCVLNCWLPVIQLKQIKAFEGFHAIKPRGNCH